MIKAIFVGLLCIAGSILIIKKFPDTYPDYNKAVKANVERIITKYEVLTSIFQQILKLNFSNEESEKYSVGYSYEVNGKTYYGYSKEFSLDIPNPNKPITVYIVPNEPYKSVVKHNKKMHLVAKIMFGVGVATVLLTFLVTISTPKY